MCGNFFLVRIISADFFSVLENVLKPVDFVLSQGTHGTGGTQAPFLLLKEIYDLLVFSYCWWLDNSGLVLKTTVMDTNQVLGNT